MLRTINQLELDEIKLSEELKTFLDANRLQSVTDRSFEGTSLLQLALNQKQFSLVNEIVDRLAAAEFKQPAPLILLPKKAFDMIRSAESKIEEDKEEEARQALKMGQLLIADFKKLAINKFQASLEKEKKQFDAMRKAREKLVEFFGTKIINIDTCLKQTDKSSLSEVTPWIEFVKRLVSIHSELYDSLKIFPKIISTLCSYIIPLQRLVLNSRTYFGLYERGERVFEGQNILNLVNDIYYTLLIELQRVKTEFSNEFFSKLIKGLKVRKSKTKGAGLLKSLIIKISEDFEKSIIKPLGSIIYTLFSHAELDFFHTHLCANKSGKSYLLTIEELNQFKTKYKNDFIKNRSQKMLSLQEFKLDQTTKARNSFKWVVEVFNALLHTGNDKFLTELDTFTNLDHSVPNYLTLNLVRVLSASEIQTSGDEVLNLYIEYFQRIFAQSQQTLDQLDRLVSTESKTFSEVKLEEQRIQKELEQKRRQERHAVRIIEEKKQVELHKKSMFAQTEQKEKEMERSSLLQSIKDLPSDDLSILIKILDHQSNLQDKINSSQFIKLVQKISGFLITPTKSGFTLLYKDKPIDGAHREHNGHKLNHEFITSFASIFRDLKIEISDILAIRRAIQTGLNNYNG